MSDTNTPAIAAEIPASDAATPASPATELPQALAETGTPASANSNTDVPVVDRGALGRAADAKLAALQQAQASQPVKSEPAPVVSGSSLGGIVFALLLVVVLIVVLGKFAKRMPGVQGSTHPDLKLIASLSLGPRERVVVVDAGGQQILLGVSQAGMQRLDILASPLTEIAATPAPLSRLFAGRAEARQ